MLGDAEFAIRTFYRLTVTTGHLAARLVDCRPYQAWASTSETPRRALCDLSAAAGQGRAEFDLSVGTFIATGDGYCLFPGGAFNS